MSSRFNPVALLKRRRSKSKSKNRNDATVESESIKTDTETPDVSSHIKPKVISKPARPGGSDSTPSSPLVRFKVFSGLRRPRSPERHSKRSTLPAVRATSVPPQVADDNATAEVPFKVPKSGPKREESPPESPAPLAQGECFELTDASDFENEDGQGKKKKRSVENTLSAHSDIIGAAATNGTPIVTDNGQGTEPQEETADTEEHSIKSEGTEKSDDEDMWASDSGRKTPTMDEYDDSSVPKLPAEYETDYPVCENSESTLSAPQTPLEEEWMDRGLEDESTASGSDKLKPQFSLCSEEEEEADEDKKISGTEDPELNATKPEYTEIGANLQSVPEEEIEQPQEKIYETSLEEVQAVPIKEPESEDVGEDTGYSGEAEMISQEAEGAEKLVEIVSSQTDGDIPEATAIESLRSTGESQPLGPDGKIIAEDVDHPARMDETEEQRAEEEVYIEPQFEVVPDPKQDPFYAAELAASEAPVSSHALVAPSIIVTSASSGSLQHCVEAEPIEPPTRPPPPVPPPPADLPPSRPPPPTSADGAPARPSPPPSSKSGPPPRPQSRPPGEESTPQRKKKKLFGVVDLGPLPSDPDPAFHLKKHLDKSIVPNPRKAIQRIIRGETKAERRQRKEQEELDRLLKGGSSQQSKSDQTLSKDWREFQELTARVNDTVKQSITKVQAAEADFVELESELNQPSGKESKSKEKDEPAEDWANFESAFAPKPAQPVDDPNYNPWEETKPEQSHEDTQFGIILDLNSDGGDNQRPKDRPVQEFSNVDLFDLIPHESATKILSAELEIPKPEEESEEKLKQEITEDIDTFLGIDQTKEIDAHPIISDPLKLLEQLKQKPEGDFFADFGMEEPVVETKHSQPVVITSAVDDDSFVEVKQETTAESTPEILDVPDEDSFVEVRKESVGEVVDTIPTFLENAPGQPQISGEQADTVQSETTLGNGQPDWKVSAPTHDNLTWIEPQQTAVKPTGGRLTEENPFGDDNFGIYPAEGQDGGARRVTEELKAVIRPRGKPIRQETLSGNNPFRRRSDDESSSDELTRAAAGIDLLGLTKNIHKHHDSFESSSSSLAEEGEKDEKVASSEEGREPTAKTFDPLQTIYPDSDTESVVSGGYKPPKSEPAISVTIRDKPTDATTKVEAHTSKKTPVIQAPPKPTSPQPKSSPSPPKSTPLPAKPEVPPGFSSPEAPAAVTASPPATSAVVDELLIDVPQEEPPSQNTTNKPELPTGWVAFDAGDFNEPAEKPFVASDKAFEVEEPLVSTIVESREPEPPRPDTPDPELDKPFHSPVSDNTYYRLWLRYPEKKTRVKQLSKYTTDRYWREIAITFTEEHGRKVVNLHEVDKEADKVNPQPYRTVRIEPYMQLSREKLQQYDKFGKVHVFKLNHVSYREMVGIRPEKFSIKNIQNLVTHKPKQNIAVDHIPVYTEILKFGSLDLERIRTLMPVFEDALMKIPAHKDTTLVYNREEVCCYVTDEYIAEVSSNGVIKEQKARTRIQCTAFVNGGPYVILGLNDKWRYGREVVRRSDILPVMHDEWISIRNPEFHSCVEMEEYEKDHMLKFHPLDGCKFELLRFRVSLIGHRELPLQVKIIYSIDGRRVSMRCELLVPGFFSASHRSGAVPCENVEIHIPVPEEWIYHFRVEKHHKYGSVHSTLRKPGRIKGLERITQMAQSLLPPSILEASIGLAKYEHLYKAVVWRIPRIPDKGEASLRPHLLTCKLILAPHDSVPEWETLVPASEVEYTMPSSTVSGATVRSISVETTGVAEKFVKYLSKYRYTVDIDYQLGTRKEPLPKSMLDETPGDYAETGNVQAGPVIVAEPLVEAEEGGDRATSEEPGDQVADLLGLDEEIVITEPAPPKAAKIETPQSKPDASAELS
ncbi:unnamed protein product [Calicophoron daubneyi]|uniref:Uncharacterized protein n=1 Tax=Calicophoron daubneyi TaxID=300641 RepID=A0AAV2TKN2_CALDB